MTVLAEVTEVPAFAPVLGSMVGLGVGIDHALFVLARHREYLACGLDPEAAAGRAVAAAGRPVVFAGGTVVVSTLGLGVANVPFITVGGFAVSIVVLTTVLASVTLLPAFLGAAGPRLGRAAAGSAGYFGPGGRAASADAGTRWRALSQPPVGGAGSGTSAGTRCRTRSARRGCC
ncbi:MMPL family transporter [Streptomyces sp. 4F14]|uniref:MMPL family transporter n=1 Tax=Streptomyces sp. 4F14 TaxID=3394380 RepID=UPI003A8C18CA